MEYFKNISYLFAFIFASFVACSGTSRAQMQQPGAEEPTIIRFDKEIYDYLQQPDSAKVVELKDKYTILLHAYGQITLENSNLKTFFANLRDYFSHPMLMQVYRDELRTFADVSAYEAELKKSQEQADKYFPGRKMPKLSLHVSGYKENVIVIYDLISISADKYLGMNYEGYMNFFKPFERQQMQPQYLVRDYLKAWLLSDSIVKVTTENTNMLTAMIDEGKVLYSLSLLLPDMNADDIIGFSSQQTEWCRRNEKKIWETIVKQNHLYSTDHMVITRYINDAPNTVPLGADSPGRAGSWTGWQIVSQYAKKTGASIDDILKANAQAILKGAKYNP